MLVLRNCKFIGELTEGTNLENGDLVLQDGKICQILPCGSAVDAEHEEFDAQGQTVIPGLINAHVHLFMTEDVNYAMPFDSVPKRTLNCLKFARFFLENGYTTVRDCGDDATCPANALRDAINAGELIGPNIVTSGPTLCPSLPGAEALAFMTTFTDTPEEVRKEARNNFSKGIDFLKLYGTGSMFCPGNVPGQRIMEADEMKAGVQIARLNGTYAAIHAHGSEAIEMAVECGVSTIEHATFINDASIKMLEGRTDAGIVPTVSLVGAWLEMEQIPAEYQEIIDLLKVSLRNAYQHDVLIGWGTDISMAQQSKEPGLEFRLRKELLGYSNLDMLKQATINSARLIRMDDKIGSIKCGKLADLIIIDGDPVQDIGLLYGSPAHVIKSGTIIK